MGGAHFQCTTVVAAGALKRLHKECYGITCQKLLDCVRQSTAIYVPNILSKDKHFAAISRNYHCLAIDQVLLSFSLVRLVNDIYKMNLIL